MPRTSRVDQLAEFLQSGMKSGADAVRTGYEGKLKANAAANDPLTQLLKAQQLQALQDDRRDRATERFAGAVEKSGIPQIAPALQSAEKSFQGKSVGPVLNMLPEAVQGIAANVKSRAGEMLDKPEWKGAGEEWQELTRLRNIDVRQFAGASQTQAESAKQMIEKGLQAGGSPDQVKRGMQMMQEAMAEHARNLEAGVRPDALQEYERRGGVAPSRLVGKTATQPKGGAVPAAAPDAGGEARKARIQELRAKLGR